jgi:hypothetical protein
MRRRSAFFTLLMLTLCNGTIEAAEHQPKLDSLDVYGTDRFTSESIRARWQDELERLAVAIYSRDGATARAIHGRIEDDLRSKGSFAYLHVSTTQSFPPNEGLYVSVDVVEERDRMRRMPFRAAPSGRFADPDGLFAEWQRYIQKARELAATGVSMRVDTCPVLHCVVPFDHPDLRPYLSSFNDGATKHRLALIEIAQSDMDAEHRATALFLLAHTADPMSLLPLLSLSIYDPNETVRNNGMRVMMGMAQQGVRLRYPIVSLIAAMDFPASSDRNKAAYVVSILAKSPEYRETVRTRALPTALRLLKLQQPNNHEPAYEILKTVSGEDFGARDYAAWERWVRTQPRPSQGER